MKRCTRVNCPLQNNSVHDDCESTDCPWRTETFPVGQLLGWTITGNINTYVYTAEHALGYMLESKDLRGLLGDVVTMSCIAVHPDQEPPA